jgi:hypothetical protein
MVHGKISLKNTATIWGEECVCDLKEGFWIGFIDTTRDYR